MRTITLNGNFTSPVNVNSSLNVDGNVNVNGELIVNDKSIAEILDENSDYTAFEVFPTNKEIPSGTVDNFDELNSIFNWNSDEVEYINKNIEFSGITYNELVESNSELFLEFYLKCIDEELDIIIDWGDGNIEKVKDNHTHPDDDDIEVINISHIYTSFKPTIVKIYGSNYYMVRNSSNYDLSKKSIIRNIFSKKYPCSSNLTHVSLICNGSNHLLMLDIPTYITQQLRIICNAFQECHNLNKVTFGYVTNFIEMQTAFYNCYNLITADIRLPNSVDRANGFKRLFKGCRNLSGDILNLFPENGFTTNNLNFVETFRDCANLTCSDYDKLGSLLWNDTTKICNPTSCFRGCDASITSQVPTSWGGTNKELETQLQLKKLNVVTTDYTAFEVYPTKKTISAGKNDEITGIKYYNEVTPWNLFGLELKTKHLQKDSNIVIDWGDGKITDVKNTISDSESPTSTIDRDSMYYPSEYDSEENEIKIEFTHKYATQGRYIVKIYGNTYWGVRAKYKDGFSNLISRIFERDLPMASCVVNVSSLCRSSLRLQKIEIANYTLFPNIINITYLFNDCTNLDTAKGFSVYDSVNKYNCFNGIMYGGFSVFTGCSNLRFSDYIIPVINTSTILLARNAYDNCSNLSVDVLTLLPRAGFCNRNIDVYRMFGNCSSITCDDYDTLGDILWNDTSKKWINTNRCFIGCTSLDFSKIPVSWGGNKA